MLLHLIQKEILALPGAECKTTLRTAIAFAFSWKDEIFLKALVLVIGGFA